jgi:hypothetical protein
MGGYVQEAQKDSRSRLNGSGISWHPPWYVIHRRGPEHHLDGFSLQQYEEVVHSLCSPKVVQGGVQDEERLLSEILRGSFQMRSQKRNSQPQILSRLLVGVLSTHGRFGHSHMG